MVIISKSFNKGNVYGMLINLFLYIPLTWIVGNFVSFSNYYEVTFEIVFSKSFWMILFISLAIILAPYYVIIRAKVVLFPTLADKARIDINKILK